MELPDLAAAGGVEAGDVMLVDKRHEELVSDGDGRGEIVASFGEDPGVDPACSAGGSLRAWLLAAGSRLVGR